MKSGENMVNLQGLVEATPSVKGYTPIFEFVVNGIQSITDAGRSDGVVEIDIIRHTAGTQKGLTSNQIQKGTILGFIIRDNGVGFNDKNTNFFDDLFTDNKRIIGGKGYGRCTALKVFRDVKIESVFEDENGKKQRRTFDFKIGGKKSPDRDMICKEVVDKTPQTTPISTSIHLSQINKKYLSQFDSDIKTIAKRLTEHLLPYLISSPKHFPKITVIDGSQTETINSYIDSSDEIELHNIKNNIIELGEKGSTQKFKFDVVLFHGSQDTTSKIILTAHHRAVCDIGIKKYIPEFVTAIEEEREGKRNRKFYIKAYISGDYLDETVNFYREGFDFGSDDGMFNVISQEDIESEVASIIKEEFKSEYKKRAKKKIEQINRTVQEELPRFNGLLKHVDLESLPYEVDTKTLAMKLHELQFEHEQIIREKFDTFEKNPEIEDKNIDKLLTEVSDLKKDQLAHYMGMRKYIIQRLDKLLDFKHKEKKHVCEDEMHNLIFPKNKDSDNIAYNEHNLRLLDERLTFNKYTISEKSIFDKGGKRIDLAVFGNKTVYREGKDVGNPVFVYEFKRPGEALQKKFHIDQLSGYLRKLRKGELKQDFKKRGIVIGDNTPMFGYLICDLVPQIVEQAENRGMTLMADGRGYYQYNSTVKAYIEIISWEKLLDDAKVRHRIFFEKLGLD